MRRSHSNNYFTVKAYERYCKSIGRPIRVKAHKAKKRTPKRSTPKRSTSTNRISSNKRPVQRKKFLGIF